MICFNIETSLIKYNLPNISGIYKILNVKTGQIYYGSTVDFRKRFFEHKNRLNKNIHSNKKLQNSYNKYKKQSFYYEILETCEIDKLIQTEQKYLNSLRKKDFNICCIAGNTTGIKLSENNIKMLRKVNMTRSPWNKKQHQKIYANENNKNISETLRKNQTGSRTKLNWHLVREIRQKYKDNYGKLSMREIAKLYNIDSSQISRIVNNITWREV